MKTAYEMAQHRALCEVLLSLKAIGYPEPLSNPDGRVCGVIARSALKRAADAIPSNLRKGMVAQLLENIDAPQS